MVDLWGLLLVSMNYLPIWWLFTTRARVEQVCDNTPGGRRGYANTRTAPRAVESGIILNQDISADTETAEGMGDLQSPQYVKRTAHMFDSRYTTQVNGSSADSRRNADGTSQKVTSQHNQPSYLSVSRSVCGYSCLSYNNGTTTSSAAMTSTTNGVSPIPYKPIQSRTSGAKSDFPISYRQTSNGHPVDTNGRENETIGKTGTLDMENNQNDAGSYGQSRTKSNILEKIERLYGTNAVTTASLWRRPVPLLQMPSDPSSRTSTAFKTINENVGNSAPRRGEKIIPIFLESSRKQLSRIESADGDYEDDHHIVKVPSSMTAKVSNIDKVSDKLSDDLYSKHDILNSNRLQKHTNGHNGTTIAPLHVNLSTVSDRDDSSVVSSRKSLDERGGISIAAPNLNSETHIIHSQVLSTDKPRKDDNKVFEPVRMGKDLFHANTDEQISLAPAQLQEKTEDSIDGESKPIFRVVSNLSSREEPEDMGWKGLRSLNVSDSPPKLPVIRSTEECSDDVMKENICVGSNLEEKNGEYFLGILQKEKSYIANLIKTAESRLETLDTSEDSPDFEFSGVVLAAIGKANLLINKKFKQFEGLCNDNIEQRKKGVGSDEPFTTKNEDLEGFWDMVLIQVDQIHSMFKDLEKGGIAPPPKKPETKKASTQKLSASKTTAASKSKSSGNTARDESRRKMLAERRRAMKNQLEAQSANAQQTSEPEVQIFVHDTASES
ncbi:unnamed protein product [Allacma fusca]|uniref:Disks large-associated protein 1 n=1 Tax=Allacma fusca TaxID=39272 RepID=A0A8J2PBC9_9HEXA|nr:unnamed protein product [Allacma fusca]